MSFFEANGFAVERCEPLFAPAAGRPWSLLFSQPLRVFGVLRRPGLRGLFFTRGFAKLYQLDRSAGPRFGYILIAVRRPGTSLGRGDAG